MVDCSLGMKVLILLTFIGLPICCLSLGLLGIVLDLRMGQLHNPASLYLEIGNTSLEVWGWWTVWPWRSLPKPHMTSGSRADSCFENVASLRWGRCSNSVYSSMSVQVPRSPLSRIAPGFCSPHLCLWTKVQEAVAESSRYIRLYEASCTFWWLGELTEESPPQEEQ